MIPWDRDKKVMSYDEDQIVMADVLISFFKMEPPKVLYDFYVAFCPDGKLWTKEGRLISVAPELQSSGCRCTNTCPACLAWKNEHLENIVNFIVYYRRKDEIEEFWGIEDYDGNVKDNDYAGSWIGDDDQDDEGEYKVSPEGELITGMEDMQL